MKKQYAVYISNMVNCVTYNVEASNIGRACNKAWQLFEEDRKKNKKMKSENYVKFEAELIYQD